jgi:hypothetical protein
MELAKKLSKRNFYIHLRSTRLLILVKLKKKEHPPIELVELIFPPLKPLICQAVASPRC